MTFSTYSSAVLLECHVAGKGHDTLPHKIIQVVTWQSITLQLCIYIVELAWRSCNVMDCHVTTCMILWGSVSYPLPAT